MNTTALVAVTLAELALVFLVLLFFVRLRRSEQMLSTLQANQDDLMDRMLRNAELEQEMVASFAQRQQELTQLNRVMEERIASLRKLLEQAEGITCSPHFLRDGPGQRRNRTYSGQRNGADNGKSQSRYRGLRSKAEHNCLIRNAVPKKGELQLMVGTATLRRKFTLSASDRLTSSRNQTPSHSSIRRVRQRR